MTINIPQLSEGNRQDNAMAKRKGTNEYNKINSTTTYVFNFCFTSGVNNLNRLWRSSLCFIDVLFTKTFKLFGFSIFLR